MTDQSDWGPVRRRVLVHEAGCRIPEGSVVWSCVPTCRGFKRQMADTLDRLDGFTEGDCIKPDPLFGNPDGFEAALDEAAGRADKSVLREALDVVYGRGEREYDHPTRNFGRIADAWNSLHPDGATVMTPEGVAIFMILKKLSRQIHCPKRDNWVDIAGYAEAASRLGERDG